MAPTVRRPAASSRSASCSSRRTGAAACFLGLGGAGARLLCIGSVASRALGGPTVAAMQHAACGSSPLRRPPPNQRKCRRRQRLPLPRRLAERPPAGCRRQRDRGDRPWFGGVEAVSSSRGRFDTATHSAEVDCRLGGAAARPADAERRGDRLSPPGGEAANGEVFASLAGALGPATLTVAANYAPDQGAVPAATSISPRGPPPAFPARR